MSALFRDSDKPLLHQNFSFSTRPAGEILQWSAIKRLEEIAGAPQRQPSPAKVRAIRRFLETDARNTIPTSVILTLDLAPGQLVLRDQDSSFAVLEFDFNAGDVRPGLVIDGQHRLMGIESFGYETQVNVVAILGANDEEKAFQFLVINNKASKVSVDHIRALALHYERRSIAKAPDYSASQSKSECGFRWTCQRWRGQSISWNYLLAHHAAGKSHCDANCDRNNRFGYIQQQKVRDFVDDDVRVGIFLRHLAKDKSDVARALVSGVSSAEQGCVICMTQYMTDALVAQYDLGRLNISDPDEITKLRR